MVISPKAIPLVHTESTDAVARFESAIAAHHGAAGAVATNSGTSALHLALMALGVGPGDEVIIPSYSCVALLNAVRLAGAREVLVDNHWIPDEMDYNLGGDPVEMAFNTHTKVIIAPFMFGVAAHTAYMSDFDVPIIEDRAMALGVEYRLWGDCAVHSFHSSKILSTGEGGMVVARTPELLARLRDLNGYSDACVADRLNEAPEYVQRVNYRMGNFAASLGVSEMRRGGAPLQSYCQRRAEIAAHYIDGLGLNITLPAGSVWGRFCFSLEGRMTPPDFVRAMAERGVEAGRGVYPALHQMLKLDGWQHSNAQRCTERLASLPLYPQLIDTQVEHITEAAKAVLHA